MSSSIEVWIAAALTLMAFSFLWRDNPCYKFVEHLFVGVSAGYWMVLGFWTTLWPNAVVPLVPSAVQVVDPSAVPPERDLLVLIPLVLGCLMLLRLWPRYAWLARWPTAFAVGTTLGYNLVRTLRSDFLAQIQATVSPGILLRTPAGGIDWLASGNQTLVILGTASCLAYFTFNRPDHGVRARMARVGLLVLMVAFGASFAFAVMSRITLLVGRLQFLLVDWLGLG